MSPKITSPRHSNSSVHRICIAVLLIVAGTSLSRQARAVGLVNPAFIGAMIVGPYSVEYPVWTGSGDSTWFTSSTVTASGTTNWVLASNRSMQTTFIDNDTPLFDDTAVRTIVNITDSNGVYPALVSFNNNTLSYTLTGNYGIQGGGSLLMNGSGAVSIYTANGYYGGTTINAGLLNIANSSALGSAANYKANGSVFAINGGTIDNASGGPLTIDNYPMVLEGSFAFGGSNPLDLGKGGVILGGTNVAVNVRRSTLTLDGTIGDNEHGYGITLNGAGTLLLTASNTYLGPTVVNGGTLQIGNGGSGASIGSTSAIIDNASLVFDHADSASFAPKISGSGSLSQTGSGLLTLTNTNTFSGNTTIGGGTLQIGGPLALEESTVVLSSTGGNLNLNGLSATLGGLSGNGNLPLGNGTLSVGNNGHTTSYSGNLSGAGSLVKIGAGRLTLSGSDTYLDGTTVDAGALIVDSATGLPDGTSLTVGANAPSLFSPSEASAIASASITPVPEPGTLALLTAAVCGAAVH